MSKYAGGLLESYFEFLPVYKCSLNDRHLYWTFGASSNFCMPLRQKISKVGFHVIHIEQCRTESMLRKSAQLLVYPIKMPLMLLLCLCAASVSGSAVRAHEKRGELNEKTIKLKSHVMESWLLCFLAPALIPWKCYTT